MGKCTITGEQLNKLGTSYDGILYNHIKCFKRIFNNRKTVQDI